MSYSFHPAAGAEYLETIAYFESKRSGLGAMYFMEFEQVMNTVCASPNRSPVEMKPDIRRKQMKKFPFTVLYREKAGSVQVLAVAHHRRRPQYWLGRI